MKYESEVKLNLSAISEMFCDLSLSCLDMSKVVNLLIHQPAEKPVIDLLISERCFGVTQSSEA